MAAAALGLARRGVASLRFQFPSMELGSRRPDPPRVAHAAVRAAVAEASKMTGLPLFAGGKSFGGRMTSQAQAVSPLPGVRGLAFFGFPLHPPQNPSIERAAHLDDVTLPMLFVQGTRDEFAELGLLRSVIEKLGRARHARARRRRRPCLPRQEAQRTNRCAGARPRARHDDSLDRRRPRSRPPARRELVRTARPVCRAHAASRGRVCNSWHSRGPARRRHASIRR